MIMIVLNEFQFSEGQNSGAIFVMRNSKLSLIWLNMDIWDMEGSRR